MKGTPKAVGIGLSRILLPGVRQLHPPGINFKFPNDPKQIGSGSGAFGIVFDGVGHNGFEVGLARDIESLGVNNSADRFAVAFAFVGANVEGKVDQTAGFFPIAELALVNHFLNVFAAFALEAEFPIVNNASTVGGQVGEPAVFDEFDKDRA